MAGSTTSPALESGLKAFGDRFPHPFTTNNELGYGSLTLPGRDRPRTLVELLMCKLSSTIREKPRWHEKFQDPAVQQKWREEVLEQQGVSVPRNLALTPNMINYVLGELTAYASLRDPETGIEVGPYDRIWKSDELVPEDLRLELLDAISPLENVPEDERDWHPRSNGQVLDLVHPSLYPIVYGTTFDTSGNRVRAPVPEGDAEEEDGFLSELFQWIPSDFAFKEDKRTIELVSPYINNVHPSDHKKLYDVIPKLLERAVPMFDRVLSDLRREIELPFRVGPSNGPDCIWPGEASENVYGEDLDWNNLHWPLLSTHELRFPDAPSEYNGGLDDVKLTEHLSNWRGFQVIVKLANIMLTPEKPAYEGGSWHVEGMKNESIVASFIYYYDSENITESSLAFRNATAEPDDHHQHDFECMWLLYKYKQWEATSQEIGEIPTKQGRTIAFPNIYQHNVGKFELIEKSKPGHRKILVFFLVDPTTTVPSASTVPAQRKDWIQRAVVEATANPRSLWSRLPAEIIDMILEYVYSYAISSEDAVRIREELMNERTQFVEFVDGQRFNHPFNLCEH
ncbi:hypothetical protein PUNSTDRAFT_118210 [Punctularia strigosozonata HHB-11173 SS5]|uniref:uncharacterized protein n=1 Tax=Punctularia strigosozonata (strain HHB-11173) TaxID=741275 RepID=UPI00044180DC|nr:uncharacterized protein PUNSTDRAFT_118210 [Punctularia strigosozonata HHB-11173 SS5]EIN12310.1 hypothetical protein PUNSTDRAFT_118210 [Punctularia strigosozonata HHB-11173 SS5]